MECIFLNDSFIPPVSLECQGFVISVFQLFVICISVQHFLLFILCVGGCIEHPLELGENYQFTPLFCARHLCSSSLTSCR